jgi:hypothetical protein
MSISVILWDKTPKFYIANDFARRGTSRGPRAAMAPVRIRGSILVWGIADVWVYPCRQQLVQGIRGVAVQTRAGCMGYFPGRNAAGYILVTVNARYRLS